MTHEHSSYSDELDLFDLFETLLDGKRLLFVFLASAMVICGAWIVFDEPEYITTVKYNVDQKPPFIEGGRLFNDFSTSLADPQNFISWKEGQPDTELVVGHIDNRALINGAYFSKSEETQFLSLDAANIYIRSGDNKLIFETLDFVKFVSRRLAEDYVAAAQSELSRISEIETTLLSRLPSGSDAFAILDNVLDIHRYLEMAKRLDHLHVFSDPKPPVKQNISDVNKLVLALTSGLMFGVVFILIRRAYRLRVSRRGVMGA